MSGCTAVSYLEYCPVVDRVVTLHAGIVVTERPLISAVEKRWCGNMKPCIEAHGAAFERESECLLPLRFR
jgi:hypothetical protein